MGHYKNIPNKFVEYQPRVGIPITLYKAEVDNSLRNKLIDQCDVINAAIVENGVLKVNKETLD